MNREIDDELGPLSKEIVRRFANRLKVLRNAQACSNAGNIPNAVENYKRYLGAVASYYRTKESLLKPDIFDKKKEVAEMLLISQVYWDLAKIYSNNPKLGDEVKRCLGKFVKFSMGNRYQYLNAEMVRKLMKKQNRHHKKLFEDAYAVLKVRSTKCYIATYCYGENHPYLHLLRNFKYQIETTHYGSYLVEWYYRTSPYIVQFCLNNPRAGRTVSTLFFKPVVKVASLVVKHFLIKK